MRIAIISDIHANIYAFLKVYEDINKEDISKILVAGDIVGYYYWPAEVIKILMEDERFICIKGNHEQILEGFVDGDELSDTYRKKYGPGYDICLKELSIGQIDWLRALPNALNLKFEETSFKLSHEGPDDSDEYIYPNSPSSTLQKAMADMDFTIIGHTHYPFIYGLNNKFLINPGSVGQPRNIGGLASYAINNTLNKAIIFKRIPFDVEPVIQKSIALNTDIEYLWKIMTR